VKAVVAGGAGFIGSHLCDALLSKGIEVMCVDNLLTGSAANVAHLQNAPGFHFVSHDITQPLFLHADLFFQLASPASPVGYRKHPIETMMVNSAGTYNLLENARKVGGRFLLASTSEAYGDPLVHPQTEDYWGNVDPVGPRACYDESKRFAEACAMEYVRSYDLDARIVRIFNTFGPRNKPNDGRVVPTFICQALRGEPITVYGDGSQTRSFCYVSDLVEGIMLAMLSPSTRGEVINLGNPAEFTILEFAETIKSLCNSPSPIQRLPLPPDRKGDPVRRRPDISKAERLLGWAPRVAVEEGLARTIQWYRTLEGGRQVAG
jgi:nucleoside-diphosphate-sugar epimerase